MYSTLSDTSIKTDFLPYPARITGTGISPVMVAADLQTYASGVQASTVVTGGLSYPIEVQSRPHEPFRRSVAEQPAYLCSIAADDDPGRPAGNVCSESGAGHPKQIQPPVHRESAVITMSPDAPPPLSVTNRVEAELSNAGLLDEGMALTTTTGSTSCSCPGTSRDWATDIPSCFLSCLPCHGSAIQFLAVIESICFCQCPWRL